MTNLFSTPEKQDEALAQFRSLIDHSGWKIYVKILEENIKETERLILEGIEDEDLDTVKRLRDRRKIQIEVKDTPQKMIKQFLEIDTQPVSDDPYATAQEIEEDRGDRKRDLTNIR